MVDSPPPHCFHPLLVSGTDTGVGKTLLTSALAAYFLHHHGHRSLGLMKLLQTGLGDQEHYQSLFGEASQIELCTPLRFAAPLAPPLAAQGEDRDVDLLAIWQSLERLRLHHPLVLVEALGSLGSPVTWELTVADLAGLWHLATVIVVGVKLGCLGQAIAQVALARRCRVQVRGLVLSCSTQEAEDRLLSWANPELLQSFTQVPIVGILPYLEPQKTLELPQLAALAARLDLEKLRWGMT